MFDVGDEVIYLPESLGIKGKVIEIDPTDSDFIIISFNNVGMWSKIVFKRNTNLLVKLLPKGIECLTDHVHDMKQYIGFTESYMYCSSCDYKEST